MYGFFSSPHSHYQEDLKNVRRKHLLKKQMEVIRKELGEESDDVEEMEELANKLEELPLSAEARKVHYQPLDVMILLSFYLFTFLVVFREPLIMS